MVIAGVVVVKIVSRYLRIMYKENYNQDMVGMIYTVWKWEFLGYVAIVPFLTNQYLLQVSWRSKFTIKLFLNKLKPLLN